jgi:hypothetical protein
MVTIDSGYLQEEWEVEILCWFQEAQHSNKEGPIHIAFHEWSH